MLRMKKAAWQGGSNKTLLRSNYTLSTSPSRRISHTLRGWLRDEVQAMRRSLGDPRLSALERTVLFQLHRSTDKKLRAVS